jgi:hypothetical protein
MSDTPQADALRAEWASLREEHADLVRMTGALRGTADAKALREHTARLHAHIDRLHALMVEVEEHHKERGPIGGLTNL